MENRIQNLCAVDIHSTFIDSVSKVDVVVIDEDDSLDLPDPDFTISAVMPNYFRMDSEVVLISIHFTNLYGFL